MRAASLVVTSLFASLLAACGPLAPCECTLAFGPTTMACGESRCVDKVGWRCSAEGDLVPDAVVCTAVCSPRACPQGACGQLPDGCGGTLSCGACTGNQTCGGGGVDNQCGCSEADAAFCVRLGKNCGAVSGVDACGVSRTVASCGTCTSPQTCGAGGVANVCSTPGCTANTCAQLGKNCGQVPDGCSGTLNCGTCSGTSTCGGSGTANVCGCAAETDAAFCTRLGKNCGYFTGTDTCGNSKSATCGSCSGTQTCGGAGQANVCGQCTAKTCTQLGKDCGSPSDGCGGTLSCGTCGAGAMCGGTGQPANVCRTCLAYSTACTTSADCCSGSCHVTSHTCQCRSYIGDQCLTNADCCASGSIIDLACDTVKNRCCRPLNKGCQYGSDCCSGRCDTSTNHCAP